MLKESCCDTLGIIVVIIDSKLKFFLGCLCCFRDVAIISSVLRFFPGVVRKYDVSFPEQVQAKGSSDASSITVRYTGMSEL